jgi:hypothetical protein
MTGTPALAAVLGNQKPRFPGKSINCWPSQSSVFQSLIPRHVGLLIAWVLQRVWKIDYRAEEQRQRDLAGVNRHIFNRTIRVTKPDACGHPIHELIRTQEWDVVFGRVRQGPIDPGAWLDKILPRRSGHGGGAQEELDRDGILGEESGASGTRLSG